MNEKKTIVAIIRSASSNSANIKLVEGLAIAIGKEFNLTIYNELKSLPHFP
jgi:hypothetical protein